MSVPVEETRSLDDFSRWKVDLLKDFLRQRGLKCTGKKVELVALAYSADVMKLPIKLTKEEISKKNALDYQHLLTSKAGKRLPDPFTDLLDGWLGEGAGVLKWPKVQLSHITEYLLTRDDRDIGKRVLGDYKEGKAYSYYDAKWLKEVFFHDISPESTTCFMKSECTPSDSINHPNHKLWVMIDKATSDVQSAYCTCFAGLGSTCNHVAALLFKMEDADKRTAGTSCTSQPCSWNNYGAGRTVLQPKRVQDMMVKKPHYHKKDNEATINPKRRRLFDPTAHSASAKMPLTINQIVNGMFRSSSNACAFEYVSFPCPETEQPEADHNMDCEVEVDTSKAVVQIPLPLTELPINSCDPEDFYKDLPTYTEEEVKLIEVTTKGQSENEDWKKHRKGRITGSVMHSVYTKVRALQSSSGNSQPDHLVNKIVCGGSDISSLAAVKYGNMQEGFARQAYTDFQRKNGHCHVIVETCGLFCMKSKVFIGASPDGKVTCTCCGTGVLEIKCPKNKEFSDLTDDFPEYLTKQDGNLHLKKTHQYYTQVQSQMGCTNTKWCDFVVFTKIGLFVERINFDDKYWAELVQSADNFFRSYVCPKLLSETIGDRHIVSLGQNVQSAIPSTSTMSDSMIIDTPLTSKVCPSTSKRRRRNATKKVESRPAFVCPSCELTCQYEDSFRSESDNTVQCASCLTWYHWDCVGYEDSQEDWHCEVCLILGLQNTNQENIDIEFF